MDNRQLFRSVVADLARSLKIRRVWPGDFSETHAFYCGASVVDCAQARQVIDNFHNTTPRIQGVQYGQFNVSLKYKVDGKYNENETNEIAFFEGVGSFTFEQQTFVIAISFVDISGAAFADAPSTTQITIFPAKSEQ